MISFLFCQLKILRNIPVNVCIIHKYLHGFILYSILVNYMYVFDEFMNFILRVFDRVQSIEHALFYWFGTEIMLL